MRQRKASLGWRRWVLGLWLMCAAVGVHGKLAATAVAGWSAPIRVAEFGNDPYVVPGTGEILYENPPKIWSVFRSGATFGSARRVALLPDDPGVFMVPFEIRVDDRGRALLAIARGSGRRTRITLAQRSRAGRWTQLRGVKIGREIAGPYIAVNRSGAAVVTWAARRKRGWRIEAIARARGSGHFGALRVLSGTHADYPQFLRPEVGERGDALVVWHWGKEGAVVAGFRDPVWAALSAPGGSWSREQPLGSGEEDARVAFAVSPLGRMLVAWIPSNLGAAGDTEPSRLLIAERHGGGLFAAQDLTAATVAPQQPVLAEARDGSVALGWTEQPNLDAKAQLLFSVGTLGAPLPLPTAVATRVHDPVRPAAAITDQGEVIAAWTVGPTGSGPIRAAIHRP